MSVNRSLSEKGGNALWPLLGVYLDDGRLEIDQNLCENSIRPTTVGKKNWLFIGAAEAEQRSAVLYRILKYIAHSLRKG